MGAVREQNNLFSGMCFAGEEDNNGSIQTTLYFHEYKKVTEECLSRVSSFIKNLFQKEKVVVARNFTIRDREEKFGKSGKAVRKGKVAMVRDLTLTEVNFPMSEETASLLKKNLSTPPSRYRVLEPGPDRYIAPTQTAFNNCGGFQKVPASAVSKNKSRPVESWTFRGVRLKHYNV